MSFTKYNYFFPFTFSLIPNNLKIISLSLYFLFTFILSSIFPFTFFPLTIQTYPTVKNIYIFCYILTYQFLIFIY